MDPTRSVSGAAARAKLGTSRRRTVDIPRKLRTCVRVVGKCASRSARVCASSTPSRPGLISRRRYSTVVPKNQLLGRRSVTPASRNRRKTWSTWPICSSSDFE